MTDRIENSELPPDELHGLVESFLDGESVDAAMLRVALADAAARDHFVDLLVIRGTLHQMDALSASAGRSRPRARWLAAAAAAALFSLTVGYVAGQRVTASTAAPAGVEAVVVEGAALGAPRPTRSIVLKPGVNWTDSAGGQ